MKSFFLLATIVLLISAPCVTFAQSIDTINVANERSAGFNLKKKLFAFYSINKLKTGALLVMLHTKSGTIKLYNDHKATAIAARLQKEQALENRLIKDAFLKQVKDTASSTGYRKQFNFCKVYFFFDDDMTELTAGKHSGFFLDSTLTKDPNITLKEDFFMVADFGPVEQESYEFPQEGGHASGSPISSSRCLIMRDSFFVQMRPPFPFNISASFIKAADKQVSALNSRLYRFYEKHRDNNPQYPFLKK